jgi:hypothetical protein
MYRATAYNSYSESLSKTTDPCPVGLTLWLAKQVHRIRLASDRSASVIAMRPSNGLATDGNEDENRITIRGE